MITRKRVKIVISPEIHWYRQLTPWAIKDCGSIILKTLFDIINLSIKSGKFPLIWKVPKVTPIFISGSRSLPENYRPISVLPIVSKLLEKAGQQD